MNNLLKIIFMLLSLFFMLTVSAEAILWPPHRVGGTVNVTGGGTLDGCTAVLSTGASQSVAGGSYLLSVPIYDPVDNPTGISIGSMVTVSIEKDGLTLDYDSFIVEAGGTTLINFTVTVYNEVESLACVCGVDCDTIAVAYEKALDGDTIFVKGDDFAECVSEDLIFDRSDGPNLGIIGGCDDDFVPINNSVSSVSSITISSGSIVVDSIVIQGSLNEGE